jgi:site-specific recombinase XerD
VSGPQLLPTWEQLAVDRPQIVQAMRRYLQQIACVLRPGSVVGADLALRSFAAFLVECAPDVVSVADLARRHVEDYKPWLAARPGQNKPRVTDATIAHRLGTLRMFFVRIDEWGWPEAPARVPMFNGDLPRLDHRLPKALDDATVAKLLRAAQADRKLLVRVTVEMLLRTGLRVGEYVALPADAVVQIGAAPWLHVPVGKLHDDRYLPLHPNLVALIDEYRSRYVPAGHPLLLPRPNGTALDRHAVTRMINRAGKAAGLPHIHPHQLRHTLATQAINRGMSLEAIAAMLGHRSLDMTLRYAKIANRTVADEYFAVTDKVDALYGQPKSLPADAIGPKMARLRREHHRLLGNGYCTRPAQLDCAFESICENCAFFQTSIEFRPTLQAQHDHAAAHGQQHRADCSAGCSTTSTRLKHHDPLDTDHPHNADERRRDEGHPCRLQRNALALVARRSLCNPTMSCASCNQAFSSSLRSASDCTRT